MALTKRQTKVDAARAILVHSLLWASRCRECRSLVSTNGNAR